MKSEMFRSFENNDIKEIKSRLEANPGLANAGVKLSDEDGKGGHPLHRICDAVFAKNISDEQAIAIAKIFIHHGANIDGYLAEGDLNTPLIAAASLAGEKLGLFFIEQGADIFYAPRSGDGSTALHWAAFCGKDRLVARLIKTGAHVNQLDTAYHSTPCGWAVHVLESDKADHANQLSCVKLLLKAGTDHNLLYPASLQYLWNAAQADPELKALLNK